MAWDTAGMPSAEMNLLPVPDAIAYLAGRWSVERELREGAPGSEGSGRFTGSAEFRAAGDGLWLHAEEGVLEWNGVRNRAVRTLRVIPLPDGTADVEFGDGRPFHHLDLRTGSWTAGHPCAPDHYEGTFTILSGQEWHLSWRVRGPAKDQILTSVHRRA